MDIGGGGREEGLVLGVDREVGNGDGCVGCHCDVGGEDAVMFEMELRLVKRKWEERSYGMRDKKR